MADAEYQIFKADIRAQALIAGLSADPYVETDAPVNDAIHNLLVAGGRLRIRAPHAPALLYAFERTHAALLDHRELVKNAAETKTLDGRLAASRETVSSLRRMYEDAGAVVVAPATTDEIAESS